MKNCLLCTQSIQPTVTWRKLFLKSIPKVICERCQQNFEHVKNEDDSDNISLFSYNEAMKNYLHQYKFLQDVALARVFSEEIYCYLSKQKAIIVPIPMHPDKMKERTFSQVDELLNAAGIHYIHLLEKTSTIAQSSKTLEERLNSEPLFRLKTLAKIEPISYILVDDIRTTGTTLRHAENILLEHGAKQVTTFTLIKG